MLVRQLQEQHYHQYMQQLMQQQHQAVQTVNSQPSEVEATDGVVDDSLDNGVEGSDGKNCSHFSFLMVLSFDMSWQSNKLTCQYFDSRRTTTNFASIHVDQKRH